ncbi:MAG: aromatic ring-hydroxylating oxygenase subunit alpha, partial [Terriglobales bacterium]
MPSPVNQIAQRRVDADIARSWTLPSRLYTDPAALAGEQQRIFSRTWQLVGRRDQVTNPGDYFTTEVAGEPLLIARDAEGKLRAFYNVCRHRAGPPAEGCGSRKVFRCSYHGWTYGLDGHLLNAPEFEGVEDFRPEEFGLAPLRVEEWALWVFVNLDDDAEPLLASLRELPAQAARFNLERLRFLERSEYLMQCNWKTYMDNYL